MSGLNSGHGMTSDREVWLDHIWSLCRTNNIANWIERAKYVFDLSDDDLKALQEIDKCRTM